jgi:hypothetical protein
MAKVPIYKNKSLKDLKGEVWKEIPFTDGCYVVSNMGRVKALERVVYSHTVPNGRRLKERIMGQSIHKQGNSFTGDETFGLAVAIQFEGVKTRAMVRRLVYEAFVAPKTKETMNDKLVYPLDGNGLNSRVENLGLATRGDLRVKELNQKRYVPPVYLLPREYYLKQAVKAGRMRRRKVCKYKPDGTLVATYPSLTKAAEKNKASTGNIGLCTQKKLKSLKGFIYRYAEEEYTGELNGLTGIVKKITQYHIDGRKIKSYNSIIEAARRLNIEPGTISRTAKKKSKHAGGFVWRYEGDIYLGEYRKVLQKRKVLQISLTGKKINSFDSISKAAHETDSPYEGIRLALQGKAKTSNGFLWKWL